MSFLMSIPLLGWFLGKRINQDDINDGLITVAKNQVKTNGLLIDACDGLVRVQKNNLKVMENNLEIQKHQFKQRVEADKREWRYEITVMENRLLTESNPHVKKIIEARIEHFKKIEKEIPFES